MIIPVNVALTSSRFDNNKLPPQLARLGTDEVVLIEFQGSFQTEGDHTGELVGHLHIGDSVSLEASTSFHINIFIYELAMYL